MEVNTENNKNINYTENTDSTNYYNSFINKRIQKYGKRKVIEAGIVLLENEREIKTLGNLAMQFCCLTECKNCPVHIYKYESRNNDEKDYIPCCSNLYNWIIEESKKVIYKDDNERG